MPTMLEAAGVEIPDSVDGDSLLRLWRGEGWREFIQGEHTTCYTHERGMQYVTDGLEKYIWFHWFHHRGKEQFFDLREDPGECRNLSDSTVHANRIAQWRGRLAEINQNRGDPRGQNGQLVPQPEGALRLSPFYERWKARAEQAENGWT